MELRTVPIATIQPRKNREYYIGADIARSQRQNNNKSAFVIGEVERNHNGTIKTVTIANIFLPPNGTNFHDQAMFIKRLDKQYSSLITTIDSNGVGQGVLEELMKETIDPLFTDPLEGWDTINTDEVSECANAPQKIFGLKAQGIQTDIITNFIDFVESGRLKLLVQSKMLEIPEKINNSKDATVIRLAHFQTDQLVDQIANLRLVQKSGGKLDVEQVVRKTDKDIWSAVAYLLYYLKNYEDKKQDDTPIDFMDYLFIS